MNYEQIKRYSTIAGIILLGLAVGFLLQPIVRGDTPDTLNVVVGTVDSGNLASLQENDNDYLNVSETVGSPAITIEMNMQNTYLNESKEWTLAIKCFYDGSAGHNIDVQLYNHSGTTWNDILDIPDSITPSVLYANFTPEDYVNSDGNIFTRVQHTTAGNINHDFGIDYIEIWEQNFDMNETFNQQVPMIINNLFTNNRTYNSNDYDLTVNLSVSINNSGLLRMNNTINTIFGYLVIDSGGVGNLSNYTTIINNEAPSFYAVQMKSGSTISHSGVLEIQTPQNTENDFMGASGRFNTVIINSGFTADHTGGTIFNGDLIIQSGSTFKRDSSPNTLTVIGDTIVNGTLGKDVWSGTFTTNSLTINSGGTFEAPGQPGETIITGRDASAYSLYAKSGSTFTSNNGLTNFTYTGANAFVRMLGTGNLYDVSVNIGVRVLQWYNDLTINNNLYINSSSIFTSQNSNYDIDVIGKVIINSQLGDNNENGLWTFGSVLINSGGVLEATSNLILQNGNYFDNFGSYIHNYGEYRISNVGISNIYIQQTGNSEPVFYDFSLLPTSGTDISRLYNDITVINYFDIGGSNTLNIDNGVTITLGNNTHSATLENIGEIRPLGNYYTITFKAVNNNYPFYYESSTNKDFDWNNYLGVTWKFEYGIFNVDVATNGIKYCIIDIDNDMIFQDLSFSDNDRLYFNNNNLTINGTFDVSFMTNGEFLETNGNLTINGFWDMNNRIVQLKLNNFIVNGEVNFYNDSLQINDNFDIYLNNNSFRTSTGEINISANIAYPLRIYGNYPNTTIDMSNLTDYFFFNVEISNMSNIDSDYITVRGLDVFGNTLIDFLPPTILTALTNNTQFTKDLVNIINLTFNITELSYLHSYNYTIQHENGTYILQRQFNFTSATNFTEVVRNLNMTYWGNGFYWFNITAYDTHNKLHSDTSKNRMKLIKVEIKDKQVGYYDEYKIKIDKHKEIKFKNFLTNQTYYSLYFKDDTDTTLTYNPLEYNFKMLHRAKLDSNNQVELEIRGDNIKYLPYSKYAGHFIINEVYYYDMQDFLESGGKITVSNKRMKQEYEYYVIILSKSTWTNLKNTTKYVTIDPLSGSVNEANLNYRFEITGSINFTAQINSIVLGYEHEGENITFNGTASGQVTPLLYVWTSSIDGEFYNSSTPTFLNNNLSVGVHTITFYAISNISTISNIESTTVTIIVNPIAKINSITFVGSLVRFSGGYTSIVNNTIHRYAWRSNVYGEFYNSTGNPIFASFNVSGNYTIYFKIMDSQGKWSPEVSQNITVTNLTVFDEEDIYRWWERTNTLYPVMAVGFFLVFFTVMMTTVFKAWWQGKIGNQF